MAVENSFLFAVYKKKQFIIIFKSFPINYQRLHHVNHPPCSISLYPGPNMAQPHLAGQRAPSAGGWPATRWPRLTPRSWGVGCHRNHRWSEWWKDPFRPPGGHGGNKRLGCWWGLITVNVGQKRGESLHRTSSGNGTFGWNILELWIHVLFTTSWTVMRYTFAWRCRDGQKNMGKHFLAGHQLHKNSQVS